MWKLSSYIVTGNTANAKYQGQSLGNLAAGSVGRPTRKADRQVVLGPRPPDGQRHLPPGGRHVVRRRRHVRRHQARQPGRLLLHDVARRRRRSRTRPPSPTCSSSTATARTRCKFFNNGQAQLRDGRFVPAHQQRRAADLCRLRRDVQQRQQRIVDRLGREGLRADQRNGLAPRPACRATARTRIRRSKAATSTPRSATSPARSTVAFAIDRRHGKLHDVRHGLQPGQVDRLRFEVRRRRPAPLSAVTPTRSWATTHRTKP